MKIAKLVYTSFITRVIVEEEATDEEIIEATKRKLSLQTTYEPIGDHVQEIVDDVECPAAEDEALTILA